MLTIPQRCAPWSLLAHAPQPAHCTPALRASVRDSPSHAQAAGRLAHRLHTPTPPSLLRGAAPRLVTHHLHHDTYSHTAHNPLASAALLSVALGCLASPGALAAAAASLSAAATEYCPLTAHAPPSSRCVSIACSTRPSSTRHASTTFSRPRARAPATDARSRR